MTVACCGCGAQHLKELHGHGTLALFVLGVLWLWSPALDEVALALLCRQCFNPGVRETQQEGRACQLGVLCPGRAVAVEPST